MAFSSQDETEGRDPVAFKPRTDLQNTRHGSADEVAASARGTHVEFVLRVDSAGISHLYSNVRKALIGVGHDLTEVIDVMRVLEQLIATSIERDSKRLRVRVHTLATRTHLKVIDRRSLNPRVGLPVDVVSRDLARASGVRPARDGTGIELWAIIDRRDPRDRPPAACASDVGDGQRSLPA